LLIAHPLQQDLEERGQNNIGNGAKAAVVLIHRVGRVATQDQIGDVDNKDNVTYIAAVMVVAQLGNHVVVTAVAQSGTIVVVTAVVAQPGNNVAAMAVAQSRTIVVVTAVVAQPGNSVAAVIVAQPGNSVVL
jgi:hypothetical protein